MEDIRFVNIEKGNSVVFILNSRGEPPRLMHGVVFRSDPKSIVIQDKEGKYYWRHKSKRAFDDGRMLSVAVINAAPGGKGEILDCAGHPVTIGDDVAFMEAPSQGFSTSIVVGEVLRVDSNGVTIRVESDTVRKYMRKPEETAVIGKLTTG